MLRWRRFFPRVQRSLIYFCDLTGLQTQVIAGLLHIHERLQESDAPIIFSLRYPSTSFTNFKQLLINCNTRLCFSVLNTNPTMKYLPFAAAIFLTMGFVTSQDADTIDPNEPNMFARIRGFLNETLNTVVAVILYLLTFPTLLVMEKI